jgi:hypothetical protein
MIVNYQKIKKIAFFTLILAISLVLSYYGSDSITYKVISPLISILQNTSAMIFAISGIWIAYLYPQAIARIVNNHVTAVNNIESTEVARAKLIVGIVILSGLVMVGLIIITFIGALVASTALYQSYSSTFNGIGLFVLITMSCLQLFSLYIVLASCINFIRDLQDKTNKKIINTKFGITHPLDKKK